MIIAFLIIWTGSMMLMYFLGWKQGFEDHRKLIKAVKESKE